MLPGSSSSPGNADTDQGRGADWPAQAAAAIERAVGTVRDKTTGPLITIARALVYGLLAAVLGVVALVLVAILLVRFIEVYLPWGGVWLPQAIVGIVFTLGGFICWRLRSPKEAT
jgi:hypothetical protein